VAPFPLPARRHGHGASTVPISTRSSRAGSVILQFHGRAHAAGTTVPVLRGRATSALLPRRVRAFAVARSNRRAGPQGVGAQFHRRDGRTRRLRHAREPRGRERAVPGLFLHRGEAVRGAQGERGRPQAAAARARRAPGRRAVLSVGVQSHRLRPGVRPVLGGLRRLPPGPRHETRRAPRRRRPCKLAQYEAAPLRPPPPPGAGVGGFLEL
jgi:hypothetical protein